MTQSQQELDIGSFTNLEFMVGLPNKNLLYERPMSEYT